MGKYSEKYANLINQSVPRTKMLGIEDKRGSVSFALSDGVEHTDNSKESMSLETTTKEDV